MLVRDIMRSPAVTVPVATTLQDAYRTMQEKGIRHLPVLDGEELAGVVTDRDLRLATSALSPAPFPAESRVSSVMTRNVLTVDPADPVEDAARTMRERKIGCMPVVDDGKLVGIITGLDLLDALIRLTGVHKPSGRIEVRLPDHPGALARLTTYLSGREINVLSVFTSPEEEDFSRTVLRVASMETRLLAGDLRREGFDVVWPPEKPCPR